MARTSPILPRRFLGLALLTLGLMATAYLALPLSRVVRDDLESPVSIEIPPFFFPTALLAVALVAAGLVLLQVGRKARRRKVAELVERDPDLAAEHARLFGVRPMVAVMAVLVAIPALLILAVVLNWLGLLPLAALDGASRAILAIGGAILVPLAFLLAIFIMSADQAEEAFLRARYPRGIGSER